MLFGEKILAYWDDIIEDLKQLMSIPSVSIKGNEKHPFGEECAKAIDCAMAMSQKYGLTSKNIDYYAMHAEYGTGEENAVVMAHVDVVPVGDGWDTNPFEAVIKNGKLFGRGAVDDKSGAVIALHCLRALKDAGITPKRKLRVVLGASEETGMTDMDYYFAREQLPTMGFTPDGEYGICHCEKGQLCFTVSSVNDSKIIKRFTAGTVINAVPNHAECLLSCTEEQAQALTELTAKSSDFTVSGTAQALAVVAHGVAAHASTPELGRNAISLLAELLYSVFGEDVGTFFSFLHQHIGFDTDGSGLGMAMQDRDSGALTCNLAILHADETGCRADFDVRFPATKTGKEVAQTLISSMHDKKIPLVIHGFAEPLYLPKDSKIVQILSAAYEAVTHSPCTIYSMGGGTYAKMMQNTGVAFGPVFAENPNHSMHMANEYVDLEDLKRHAQICLEAMYRMAVAE